MFSYRTRIRRVFVTSESFIRRMVARLIFALGATGTGNSEDYERKIYPEYRRLDLQNWIIGPPMGGGPFVERPADILKIWPSREPSNDRDQRSSIPCLIGSSPGIASWDDSVKVYVPLCKINPLWSFCFWAVGFEFHILRLCE
jgi:hypothetical protein